MCIIFPLCWATFAVFAQSTPEALAQFPAESHPFFFFINLFSFFDSLALILLPHQMSAVQI